jgi:hypothetical protein
MPIIMLFFQHNLEQIAWIFVGVLKKPDYRDSKDEEFVRLLGEEGNVIGRWPTTSDATVGCHFGQAEAKEVLNIPTYDAGINIVKYE